MIIIGRPIDGVPLNGLEYLMNENNSDYRFFVNKIEAMDFLNSALEEPLSHEEIAEYFFFLNTETDF